TSNTIMVGQQLKLPFLTHTVIAGDTLYSIAKRYNTTVDQIRTTNQLKTDMLSIGSKLRIPQGMTPQQVDNTVPEQTPKQEVPTLEISTYRVVSGDTLYGISVKFGTTVDQLKSLNNL